MNQGRALLTLLHKRYTMSNPINKENFYEKLLELGSRLPPFQEIWRIPANRVEGCQSLMYLHTYLQEERLYFVADADALISRGIAAVWISHYQGCSPKELWMPPPFLSSFETHLSMTRTHGAMAFWNTMKRHAVGLLSATNKSPQDTSEILVPLP